MLLFSLTWGLGMTNYYAGIGSRKVPIDQQRMMTDFAKFACEHDWILRSGAAPGADQAFEQGAGDQKEIFTANSNVPESAFEIAAEVHPAWNACSAYAKRLHARNVMQILGQNLDAPVRFVLCWTPDGCEDHFKRTMNTGGTGQAISVASLLNIPVFNMRINSHRIIEAREFITDEIRTPNATER
jgi:hypothetical protein